MRTLKIHFLLRTLTSFVCLFLLIACSKSSTPASSSSASMNSPTDEVTSEQGPPDMSGMTAPTIDFDVQLAKGDQGDQNNQGGQDDQANHQGGQNNQAHQGNGQNSQNGQSSQSPNNAEVIKVAQLNTNQKKLRVFLPLSSLTLPGAGRFTPRINADRVNEKIARKTSYVKYVNHYDKNKRKTLPAIELDLKGLQGSNHFDVPRDQLPNGDVFPSYIDGEEPIAVIQLTSEPIREQNFFLYISSNQLALFIPSFFRLKCLIICVDYELDLYNATSGSVTGNIALVYGKTGNKEDKGGFLLTVALPRRMASEMEKIFAWVEVVEQEESGNNGIME